MVLIGGDTRTDEGVEYLELEMNKYEFAPPRMVEKSTTLPISDRLLTGSLNPGGGAKPSVFGGDLQSVGTGIIVVGVVVGASPHTLIYSPDGGETQKLLGPWRPLDVQYRGCGGGGAGLRAKAARVQS